MIRCIHAYIIIIIKIDDVTLLLHYLSAVMKESIKHLRTENEKKSEIRKHNYRRQKEME